MAFELGEDFGRDVVQERVFFPGLRVRFVDRDLNRGRQIFDERFQAGDRRRREAVIDLDRSRFVEENVVFLFVSANAGRRNLFERDVTRLLAERFDERREERRATVDFAVRNPPFVFDRQFFDERGERRLRLLKRAKLRDG